jgi:hypothetical protein
VPTLPVSSLDASADGRDVFIGTLASLVPQDYGLRDIYDVRVEGGFPPPAPPTPSSFTGPAGRPKPRCPKGRCLVGRGGKAHCVRKHRPEIARKNVRHNDQRSSAK